MAKKQKEIPGGIVKINFDEQYHTYGRILNYGDVALYDYKTSQEIMDLNNIIKHPIIYKMIVNINGVQKGRWPIVGIVPLEDNLRNSKYYLEDLTIPDRFKIIENSELKWNIPKSECIGLEVGAIWDPTEVEEFLRDYYAGRDNVNIKMLDVLHNFKLRKS